MITPGSLDYLYYNDVLDHIPYEAYEVPNYAALNNLKQNSGNQYMDLAQQGAAYQNSISVADSFMSQEEQNSNFSMDSYSSNYGDNFNSQNAQNGSLKDQVLGINPEDYASYPPTRDVQNNEENLSDAVNNGVGGVYQKINSIPAFVKGLISGGIMLGTLYLILRKKH